MNSNQTTTEEQALHILNHTQDNLFLTGKAGTGKTTFLRNLHQKCHKKFIVAAPTGIAAVNAGGVTLHSFFKLPIAPYTPRIDALGRFHDALPRYDIQGDKLEVINKLELLVIDEISMVRADLLDAIDDVFRHYRRNSSPFGGVQLLLIGDLQQLSPICKKEEAPILSPVYHSMYFFASKAIQASKLVMLELNKIYRQQDPMFTGFLNEIRIGHISPMGRRLLDSLLIPGEVDEKTITVCSHRKQVNEINDVKLQSINSEAHIYYSKKSGDISTLSLPMEAELVLKKGARVMFTVNDTDSNLYYNGSMGIVTQLNDDSVVVRLDSNNTEILVRPYTWKNNTYVVNPETQMLEIREIGNCKQLPLVLAWAITIHKCQGLTFEHLAIDAAGSFAPGQVYVALSRCKQIKGISLLSPITQKQLFNNTEVEAFYATCLVPECPSVV